MRKVVLLIAGLFALSAQAKNDIPKPYLSPEVEKQASQPRHSLTRPGLCELEVANLSHKAAFVDIVYDNFSISQGNQVNPGYSLYVPLHYSGYCHNAAYALIYSPETNILYKNFGYVDQTLKIYSGLNSMIAVKKVKRTK